VFFGYFLVWMSTYIGLVCDSVKIKESNTFKDTLSEIGLCLHILLISPLINSEHNWEDLCIQLRNHTNMHF
jgi:hypothetical protein